MLVIEEYTNPTDSISSFPTIKTTGGISRLVLYDTCIDYKSKDFKVDKYANINKDFNVAFAPVMMNLLDA
jgi:hypothetical protein